MSESDETSQPSLGPATAPPAEPSDRSLLDQLMSSNPLTMIKDDPKAIDKLIAYYRHNRKLMADGIKPVRPKRAKAEGADIKLDLSALGITKPAVQGIKRRV